MIKNIHEQVFEYIKVSFWLIFCIFAVAFAAPILGEIEGRLFPVATDFNVDHVESTRHSVRLSGTLRKARDCDFVDLTAYVGHHLRPDNPRERLHLVFEDQPADVSSNRLRGKQAWGIWEVMRPRNVDGPHVWIVVRHRCHSLWETVTLQYETEAADFFTPPADRVDDYDVEASGR